eukprot:Blabericola_migrator_1__1979@NODE_153_length_12753_cov_114_743891_g134_i0_p6_GENE_NODE_153_length_12753_cov_114_743891_g134_i0NODE_153_length_12753_cov_114_743891_g134_i0_p6_ORF_typecomplete_len272_score45_84_NODE_153_length_12753_cov_114_743891_g134_i01170012515
MASIRFARQFQQDARCDFQGNRAVDICSVLLPLSAMFNADVGDVLPEASDVATSSNAAPGDDRGAALQRWADILRTKGIKLNDESCRLLRVLNGDMLIESTAKAVEESLGLTPGQEVQENMDHDTVSTSPPDLVLRALCTTQKRQDKAMIWNNAIKLATSHVLDTTLKVGARLRDAQSLPDEDEDERRLRNNLKSLYFEPVEPKKPLVQEFSDLAQIALMPVPEHPSIHLTHRRLAAMMEESLTRKVVIDVLDDIVAGDQEKHAAWIRKLD